MNPLYDLAMNLIADLISRILGREFLKKTIGVPIGIVVVACIVLAIFAIIFVTRSPQLQLDRLSSYLLLGLVNNDLDGSDFAWISHNDKQADSPALVDTTIDDISGTFVKYSVELRSVLDEKGYSNQTLLAVLERALRNIERGSWDTLLATVYIQSDERAEIYVAPYLRFLDIGTVYLGFGQVISTNQWTPIIWTQLTNSTNWSDEFFEDLYAMRDKYEIPNVGHLRLTHILTKEKKEGSKIGFEFRLLSDLQEGEEDVFKGAIYISSMTFLPKPDNMDTK